VLALSTRLITPVRAREILAAWFDTEKSTDEWNRRQLARLAELEDR
jgi:ribose 5-phosphate isomerase RpiB